ncbi:hypothetical protein ElyMa_000740200 [Elysia marginata]|uniref:Uncharacterized protein n=1 Tax=Elysia marginata TaxID=1093978 RepID=A0AAV4GNS9_9GAST|nr:hypothetical protein ElyMa_000740200 [Elysia marginata]
MLWSPKDLRERTVIVVVVVLVVVAVVVVVEVAVVVVIIHVVAVVVIVVAAAIVVVVLSLSINLFYNIEADDHLKRFYAGQFFITSRIRTRAINHPRAWLALHTRSLGSAPRSRPVKSSTFPGVLNDRSNIEIILGWALVESECKPPGQAERCLSALKSFASSEFKGNTGQKKYHLNDPEIDLPRDCLPLSKSRLPALALTKPLGPDKKSELAEDYGANERCSPARHSTEVPDGRLLLSFSEMSKPKGRRPRMVWVLIGREAKTLPGWLLFGLANVGKSAGSFC